VNARSINGGMLCRVVARILLCASRLYQAPVYLHPMSPLSPLSFRLGGNSKRAKQCHLPGRGGRAGRRRRAATACDVCGRTNDGLARNVTATAAAHANAPHAGIARCTLPRAAQRASCHICAGGILCLCNHGSCTAAKALWHHHSWAPRTCWETPRDMMPHSLFHRVYFLWMDYKNIAAAASRSRHALRWWWLCPSPHLHIARPPLYTISTTPHTTARCWRTPRLPTLAHRALDAQPNYPLRCSRTPPDAV